MIIKNWKKDILTIPNLLSLFRLLLIPVYTIIYLKATSPAHYYLAGGILALSCLTDLLDGKIARKFHMISTVGKILDPLADKITQFTLILCLSIRFPLLWVVAALFVLKESFQLVAGAITLKKGKMLYGALFEGKLCTVILFLSLIVMVLFPQIGNLTVTIIAAVDGLFLSVSFAAYLYTYSHSSNMIQKLDADPQ